MEFNLEKEIEALLKKYGLPLIQELNPRSKNYVTTLENTSLTLYGRAKCTEQELGKAKTEMVQYFMSIEQKIGKEELDKFNHQTDIKHFKTPLGEIGIKHVYAELNQNAIKQLPEEYQAPLLSKFDQMNAMEIENTLLNLASAMYHEAILNLTVIKLKFGKAHDPNAATLYSLHSGIVHAYYLTFMNNRNSKLPFEMTEKEFFNPTNIQKRRKTHLSREERAYLASNPSVIVSEELLTMYAISEIQKKYEKHHPEKKMK